MNNRWLCEYLSHTNTHTLLLQGRWAGRCHWRGRSSSVGSPLWDCWRPQLPPAGGKAKLHLSPGTRVDTQHLLISILTIKCMWTGFTRPSTATYLCPLRRTRTILVNSKSTFSKYLWSHSDMEHNQYLLYYSNHSVLLQALSSNHLGFPLIQDDWGRHEAILGQDALGWTLGHWGSTRTFWLGLEKNTLTTTLPCPQVPQPEAWLAYQRMLLIIAAERSK